MHPDSPGFVRGILMHLLFSLSSLMMDFFVKHVRFVLILAWQQYLRGAPLGVLIFLGMIGTAQQGFGFGIERRSPGSQAQKGYQLFPLAFKIPGVDASYGGGLAVYNLGGANTDFATAFSAGGVQAYGLGFFDMHWVQDALVFDVAYFAHKAELPWYPRGGESQAQERLYPRIEGARTLAQLTWRAFSRRFELFYRHSAANTKVVHYRTPQGDTFPALNAKHRFNPQVYGFLLDFTDDRSAPRVGLRYQGTQETIPLGDKARSQYSILGQSLSIYLPFRQRKDVLEVNISQSDAHSVRQGALDASTATRLSQVDCSRVQRAALTRCQAVQAQLTQEQQAENMVGSGAALGGANRLRSYAIGRFRGAHSRFEGVEYRWNITRTEPGHRLGWQIAFFAEQGKVADNRSTLSQTKNKKSMGLGLRGWLSKLLLRFDVAQGSEGSKVSVFAGLPWGGGFAARGP